MPTVKVLQHGEIGIKCFLVFFFSTLYNLQFEHIILATVKTLTVEKQKTKDSV